MIDSSRLATALSDRYRLERELGAGGMATVWLAEDLRHRRRVAVKVLRPDLSAVLGAERFSAEIELTAGLQHANILPLFDSGEAAGQLFYVMPYVDGETLRARMGRGPVPVDEALAILRDLARALGYAHGRGVVHRDIKPENVLLAGGAATVADFGIAKALAASRTTAVTPGAAGLTSAGTSLGTPGYMAPEQAAGDPSIDLRADLYSWGVVAWELLAGRHPFAEHTSPQALMAAHVSAPPPSLAKARPDLPAALTSLVMRCLAKAPKDRPRDGAELAAQLGTAAISGANPASAPRPRAGRVALAVLAVAVLGLGSWRVIRSRGAGGPGVTEPRSIAVLPFEIGSDTANAYVADGLSAELTTKLAKIPGLRVRAYSAAGMTRGVAPKEAAELLGVSTVVTARVRRAAAKLHVNASLIDGQNAEVMWSESFDGEDADQFALQERLAEAIAGALRITLNPATRAAVAGRGTNDPVAHDLVQRARYLAERLGDSTSIRTAIRMAEDATRRDSMYVDAWSTLGGGWLNLADDVEPGARVIEPARRALDRALAVRPDDPTALGWAGALQTYLFHDLTTSQSLVTRALAADPSNPIAQPIAAMNTYVANPDSGARLLAKSIFANPMSVVSLNFMLWVTEVFRNLPADSAKLACTRLGVLAPELGVQCDVLRTAEMGRSVEARALLRAIDPGGLRPNALAYLAMTAATIGDTALTRDLLGKVEAIAPRRYVREDAVAVAYARIGEREASIRWWRKGAGSHVSGMLIAGKPEFRDLRADPRFPRVVKGLPSP